MVEAVHFSFFLKEIFVTFIFERERRQGRGTEKEREREREGQRETQNLKQAPGSELSAQSLMWGSNPQTVRS